MRFSDFQTVKIIDSRNVSIRLKAVLCLLKYVALHSRLELNIKLLNMYPVKYDIWNHGTSAIYKIPTGVFSDNFMLYLNFSLKLME